MYAAGHAPAHSLSTDQLRQQGLRLARGQQSAAYLNDHHGSASGTVRRTRLYDQVDGERMRLLSPGQQRAMAVCCPRRQPMAVRVARVLGGIISWFAHHVAPAMLGGRRGRR